MSPLELPETASYDPLLHFTHFSFSCLCCSVGSTCMESVAVAYRLLLGQDTADVGRWFEEFCAASGDGRGLPRLTDGGGSGAGGGKKLPGVAEGPEEEGEEEGQEEEGGKGGHRGRSKTRGRRLGRKLSPEDERSATAAARRRGGSRKRVSRMAVNAAFPLCDANIMNRRDRLCAPYRLCMSQCYLKTQPYPGVIGPYRGVFRLCISPTICLPLL